MSVNGLTTPMDLGYRMPAEWTPHQCCFIGWPCRDLLWGSALGLARARAAYAQVARAIARFEPVRMLARPEHVSQASEACGDDVTVVSVNLDDSWLRDTGPTFVRNIQGQLAGVHWRFNGWGGKYQPHNHDAALGAGLLSSLGVTCFPAPLIAEGGALHVDGEGTLLVTEQCLLNPNRNPGLTRPEIEQILCQFTGASKIIWLGQGLDGDETDGHIDNVVCFAGPGKLLIQGCDDPADPNYAILRDNMKRLTNATDARGKHFNIVTLPSPTPRKDATGNSLILSYVNFYLANGAVIMPGFDDPADAPAATLIAAAFPDRKVVQIPALDIVAGGGGIHCITQQMPCAG